MPKTLFINACVRENSRTLELGKHVLKMLGGEYEELRLYEADLVPLNTEVLKERDLAFAAKDFSKNTFSLARQFAAAEIIVIAAPYWDLMFPSVVKTYLESVTVNGLTFAYSESGVPYGLCKGKRLIYVTTSGGPILYNFGYDYVCALARNFYGIQDVQCISAEKLDIRGADAEEILRGAKESVAL